ncbi:ABC transporter ATP-binding protein [Clostridium sp. AF19-22AC]|jgi:ABC-type multidrug transport system fused ATPase/permease subunit|uniref:ABC transporter ATP-binding protein n=1 Tax=Clostridia TaxID=186801 RepID=UPI000E50D232|nr:MULTISPECIES: ABC transporter ATP-binding protein [Clostridia]RHR32441.1 ABC transporter ATP-binding protein [Clostridium sp. AF19-22AC]
MDENRRSIWEMFIIYKKIIKIISHFSKKYIIVTIIMSLIRGILPVVTLIIMRYIMNSLQQGGTRWSYLLTFILIYAGVNLFESILEETYSLYSLSIYEKFTKYISLLLINKSFRLKLEDFETKETYNLISRAQEQSGEKILTYFERMLNVFQEFIAFILYIYIIAEFKWSLVPIAIMIPLIKSIFAIKLGQLQYKVVLDRTDTERKCWYINFLATTGLAFKEILIYGLGSFLENHYKILKDKIINQDIKIGKIGCIFGCIFGLLEQVITTGLFGYFIYLGFNRVLLIGDINTYINCLDGTKASAESIFNGISENYKNALYLGLLFEFLDLDERQEEGNIKIKKIESVELIDVSYTYKNQDVLILNNISLKLCDKEILGLVGKNGSGKTTLIKLILGFYDDYKGKILINGIDLKKIDKKMYYAHIACVFQDFIKYEMSLRNNVGYGDVRHLDDEDYILKMLKKIGFKKVNQFKYGIDTILGSWFGDIQLSSGEWQKIAIARAMIKDADMYILDEPDAALDSVAEMQILDQYKNILTEKIGIIISHKVTHINKICNTIVVIDQGRIVERGTHNQLMEIKGIYYEMYSKQIN